MDRENLAEMGREYRGTVAAYCRSCREVELFDRYRVTKKHLITGEVEESVVSACQGCEWEFEVKG